MTLNVYSLYTVQLYSTNMLRVRPVYRPVPWVQNNTTKAAERVAANDVTAPVEIAVNMAGVEVEVDVCDNA